MKSTFHMLSYKISFILFFSCFLFSPLSYGANTLQIEWGGQIKVRGSSSWHDNDSIFSLEGTGPYFDGSSSMRLKNTLIFSRRGYLETHYESVFTGGDTRRKTNKLLGIFKIPETSNLIPANQINDDHRLMDLTHTISREKGYALYHRLDRFSLTLNNNWGTVNIGRQALTWGNGMIFNPMDLFNPFSPTDIEREYKIGDDMVSLHFTSIQTGDFQFLYVPRREIITGDIDWDQASLAGKWHFTINAVEFDIMAAKHYNDGVFGMGSTGYLKNAVWRMDGTWTNLKENQNGDTDGFFTFVANVDYSWIWWEKNLYGFLEFYHNGLGRSDYNDAFFDPNVTERLLRGELFTLGKNYLSAFVRFEPHPLFNTYLTIISNLYDPSVVILPRVIWDMAENIQLTLGGNLYHGDHGTEFGGIKIPLTDLYLKFPNSVYTWFTCYF